MGYYDGYKIDKSNVLFGLEDPLFPFCSQSEYASNSAVNQVAIKIFFGVTDHFIDKQHRVAPKNESNTYEATLRLDAMDILPPDDGRDRGVSPQDKCFAAVGDSLYGAIEQLPPRISDSEIDLILPKIVKHVYPAVLENFQLEVPNNFVVVKFVGSLQRRFVLFDPSEIHSESDSN